MTSFAGDNPLDRASWPEKMTAKVIEPGEHPRLHGYDIQRDLAKHYRWSEVVFLALTGELPREEVTGAIDVALIFLSAVSVNEAPGHAAVLAGFCGTTHSAAASIVAAALAEQARCAVEEYFARKPSEATTKEGALQLRARLEERGMAKLAVETRKEATTAALSILEQCGLSTPSQLESAWVMARLPVALAETWRQPASQFIKYPSQLPKFIYTHPRNK